MTSQCNEAMAAALIYLDPPDHRPQRKLFTEQLSPKALRPVRLGHTASGPRSGS